MEKEEFEAKVLEHMIAISDLYAKYNPESYDILDITICNIVTNGNRNDIGSWNTRSVFCSNRKTLHSLSEEEDISFYAWKDIEDETYKRANPEDVIKAVMWKKNNLGTIGKEDYWNYLDSFSILEVNAARVDVLDSV